MTDPRSRLLDVDAVGAAAAEDYVPFSGGTNTVVVRKRSRVVSSTNAAGAVWCWWCCHPFDGPPVVLPTKYDEKKDVFFAKGAFCSWACVKAYNNEHTGYQRGIVTNLITLLARRSGPDPGKIRSIVSAPPRQTLKVFGGFMDIDQFRNVPEGKTYAILPNNMVFERPNIVVLETKKSTKPKKTATQPAEENAVDFDDIKTKSEPLRLKRTKPAPKHPNTIDNLLGISVQKTL